MVGISLQPSLQPSHAVPAARTGEVTAWYIIWGNFKLLWSYTRGRVGRRSDEYTVLWESFLFCQHLREN